MIDIPNMGILGFWIGYLIRTIEDLPLSFCCFWLAIKPHVQGITINPFRCNSVTMTGFFNHLMWLYWSLWWAIYKVLEWALSPPPGSGTHQEGVATVLNLVARGKDLTVKFPMWGCVHAISLPLEYQNFHGCEGIVKSVGRGCTGLKGLKETWCVCNWRITSINMLSNPTLMEIIWDKVNIRSSQQTPTLTHTEAHINVCAIW